jgi:endonuclease/exonuclease/phosphatase family metal-dependent hydrolase
MEKCRESMRAFGDNRQCPRDKGETRRTRKMDHLHSRSISLWRRVLVSTLTIACIANVLSLNTAAWAQGRNIGGKRAIDVATFNLYVGADFGAVLTLNPSDPDYLSRLIGGVASIHGEIMQSDFPARADALADQIVIRLPDLIALQEVSLIRRQSPGDLVVGGTAMATEVELDYLSILLAAIESRGGHYAVASMVQDTDVEVPLWTGEGFDDVRLTDRDVILVRTDLPPGHLRISNPQGENFGVALPLPIGVFAYRGWCSIDVESRGRSFRFINAHLEDALPPGLPNIQIAQAYELLSNPAATTLPVILAGDFNSDAYGNYSSETYALLTGQQAGQGQFTDAWTVAQPQSLGFTWGHDPLLLDATVPLTLRLDLVLYRGASLVATDAEVVDPLLGPAAPRWFSDHGGVVSTIAIH